MELKRPDEAGSLLHQDSAEGRCLSSPKPLLPPHFSFPREFSTKSHRTARGGVKPLFWFFSLFPPKPPAVPGSRCTHPERLLPRRGRARLPPPGGPHGGGRRRRGLGGQAGAALLSLGGHRARGGAVFLLPPPGAVGSAGGGCLGPGPGRSFCPAKAAGSPPPAPREPLRSARSAPPAGARGSASRPHPSRPRRSPGPAAAAGRAPPASASAGSRGNLRSCCHRWDRAEGRGGKGAHWQLEGRGREQQPHWQLEGRGRGQQPHGQLEGGGLCRKHLRRVW